MNQKQVPNRIRPSRPMVALPLLCRSWILMLMCLWIWQALPAAAHIINVQWSYSGSAVSYILYENGAQVCTSVDPTVLQMDCDIFLEDTPMVFTLTAVDADGVESPQSAPYTLIPPSKDVNGNYIPQIDLQASVTTGDAPLAVNFDASASNDIDGTVVEYDWDFGDGDIGSGAIADHTFTLPGVYTTSLTIYDDSGSSSTKTVSITVTDPNANTAVANEPPKAVITATPMQSGTSDIAFDAYSSSDADGVISSYSWNFGDGETASGDYAEHKYLAAGDYTVVLTVIDDAGASSQDTMTISIVDELPANVPPVAIISASLQKYMVHFDWDYTADSGLAGFRFYQDNALVCEIADPTARQADCLAYIDAGQVQMWLSAYDQAGVETDSQIFTFDSTGIFDSPVSADAPLAVHFSAGASYDPDGSLASFAWDFGDGSVAQGQAVDYVFTSAGVYTVTLTVTDDAGDTTQTTKEITVTGVVNTPPTVQAASFSTLQDKSISATLTGSDPEGDPLTFSIVANGSKGVVTITNPATGVFTYVPKTGVYGTDAFIFKANDGVNDSSAATVSIDIQKVNQAPVANSQSISLAEDSPFNGTFTASDADGDSLTYTLVANGSKGFATINDASTGSFTYVPQANANGTDSLTFKVNDGNLDSAVATLSVTITPVNDAPLAEAMTVATDEDTPLRGELPGRDVDNDPLVYTVTTVAENGEAVVNSDGTFSYTPKADFNGVDSFAYNVSDGSLSAIATVTVTVNPVNDAPQASDDTAETEVDQKITIDVLTNDTDIDGDSLQISRIDNPGHGEAVLDGGKIIYTPAAGYIGSDSMTYTVSDGQLTDSGILNITVTPPRYLITMSWEYDSAASVTGFRLYYNGSVICETSDPAAREMACKIPVSDEAKNFNITALDANGGETALSNTLTYDPAMWNHAPIAQNISLQTSEDTVLNAILPATDQDGDTLVYTLQTNGIKGVAIITDSTSGSFTYTPQANIFGDDSFTFIVNDGKKDSAVATVTVTINPVNDAPVAVSDTVVTEEDKAVTVSVLANDTDVDGDTLILQTVTPDSHGAVTINGDQAVYTPLANYNGDAGFTYTISDGNGGTASGTVAITITAVNDAPVAVSDTAVTEEDKAVAVSVFANDTDIDGDTLILQTVTPDSHGVVTINGDQAVYTPLANYNGEAGFTYTISDGNGGTASGMVAITITAVNDAPVANADLLTVPEDSKVSVDLLANDTDIEGDTLLVTSLGQPAHGTVTLSDNKAIYSPVANYHGNDTFTYNISDGMGGTATGTVSIILTSVNDMPVAVDDKVETEGVVPVNIALLNNDTDVDGDTLQVVSVTQPLSGQVVLTDGLAVYTARQGFAGTDSFAYTISDGQGGTATAVASVAVIPPQQTISYSWEFDSSSINLAGFRLYRNGTKICETSDVNSRTLTCKAPIIDGDLTFALTAVDTAGVETALSNTITYKAPPVTQDVSFSWDYDDNVQPAGGFKVYMNGALICETSDAAARTLKCQIPKETGAMEFYLTAVDANGAESSPSNSMKTQ